VVVRPDVTVSEKDPRAARIRHLFSGRSSRLSKSDARTSTILANELDSSCFNRQLKLNARLVRHSRSKIGF
jgi:hypothetical protein